MAVGGGRAGGGRREWEKANGGPQNDKPCDSNNRISLVTRTSGPPMTRSSSKLSEGEKMAPDHFHHSPLFHTSFFHWTLSERSLVIQRSFVSYSQQK